MFCNEPSAWAGAFSLTKSRVTVFISLFLTNLFQSLFAKPTNALRLKLFRAAVVMKALRAYVLTQAYAVWSNRGILATKGVTVRSGDIVGAYLMKGVGIIIEIIMLVIAGYFAALLVPGVLTAFATTALTSVSTAVQTLFQTILPFTFVTVIIMLFLSVLVETFRAI